MRYENMTPGRFISRPNRFIAQVTVDGAEVTAHVKNTGRCKELLVPGATVYLVRSGGPHRKTAYDLVAVKKGDKLINMDSQAPNKVFEEWAAAGGFMPDLTLLRRETVWGNSRFDFYWEAEGRRGFVEVKGVTLEVNGHAYFPDAPTERGVKHLEELMAARRAGYEAAVCFVIQMKEVEIFSPNDATHPAFGAALRRAGEEGVSVLAYRCDVVPGRVTLAEQVPVEL